VTVKDFEQQAGCRVRYFKRYRMEVDLQALPAPQLPAGFCWVAWGQDLLDLHAEALYESFHQEIDATIFPSLGNRQGCQTLMAEISRKSVFVPTATWLLAGPDGPCGSVQGLSERNGTGAIQNLGITPGQRGQGLGAALLLQALHGFRWAGMHRAMLEVTAQNDPAIRLYRRLGFRRIKTLYKAVPDFFSW
jgi:RimJ/RimL family protein N-acetyltransferase